MLTFSYSIRISKILFWIALSIISRSNVYSAPVLATPGADSTRAAGATFMQSTFPPAEESPQIQHSIVPNKFWEDQKHFGTGLIELAVVEFIPWANSRWVSKFDPPSSGWANVNAKTWWRNISSGWVYDEDAFFTNYLEHPYHGSLYFNSGRTTGYSFWESTTWAFSGSFLWEYFGETTRPSINDLVNTTVSGINLGEITYRLSTMVTDNSATGSKRFFQEFLGTLINPVRGVNRLISGEAYRVFANPVWRIPNEFTFYCSGGLRWTDTNGDPNVMDLAEDGALGFTIVYGDRIKAKEPFSYFRVFVRTFSGTPRLNVLETIGYLGGAYLMKTDDVQHKLNINMEYDFNQFLANSVESTHFGGILYGATTMNFNFLSSYSFYGTSRLVTQIGLSAVLMGATPSDHYFDKEGRNYDFGPGFGSKLGLSIHDGLWDYLKISYYGLKIFTASEPQHSRHDVETLSIDAQLPVYNNFAIGFGATAYFRNSTYEYFPDVQQDYAMARIFFTTALY